MGEQGGQQSVVGVSRGREGLTQAGIGGLWRGLSFGEQDRAVDAAVVNLREGGNAGGGGWDPLLYKTSHRPKHLFPWPQPHPCVFSFILSQHAPASTPN